MPAKYSRHVALTGSMADWVAAQVAQGKYTSASDLVRTAIRHLQEREEIIASRKTVPFSGQH
jgi:antitoxin ParD1/3/4